MIETKNWGIQMKSLSKTTAVASFGLVLGLTLATAYSVNAAGSNEVVAFCVNKTTKVVTQKTKCAKTETVLAISKTGQPGPAGSPGATGPTGAPGPAGASGSNGAPGTGLVVLDANNQIVGYPIGSTGDQGVDAPDMGINGSLINGIIMYMPSINKVVALATNGQPFTIPVNFTSTDCTGQAVSAFSDGDPLSSSRTIYVKSGTNYGWYSPGAAVSLPITFRSQRDSDGSCRAINISWTAQDGVSIHAYNPTSSPLPSIAGPIRLAVR